MRTSYRVPGKVGCGLFRISPSAFSLATSRRSRSISSCSGFIWPFPAKDWPGSSQYSRTHLRNTFSSTSRSRAAWATVTPRSLTSFTASSLYSRLNIRLCIHALRFQEEYLNSMSMKPAAGHFKICVGQDICRCKHLLTLTLTLTLTIISCQISPPKFLHARTDRAFTAYSRNTPNGQSVQRVSIIPGDKILLIDALCIFYLKSQS